MGVCEEEPAVITMHISLEDPELVLQKIDWTDRKYNYWERQVHAALGLLAKAKIVTTDELRRAIEGLHEDQIKDVGYYTKWAIAIAQICHEKKVLSIEELEDELGPADEGDESVLFEPGEMVWVRDEYARSRWRRPHLRTPGYIFGQSGVIERSCGVFPNPELLAYAKTGRKQPLYRVIFKQAPLWEAAGLSYEGAEEDSVVVEVYQSWLRRDPPAGPAPKRRKREDAAGAAGGAAGHAHGHGHAHEHEHQGHCGPHEPRPQVEARAVEGEGPEDPGMRYAEALLRALVGKGVLSWEGLRRGVEAVDGMGAKGEGARVVARAWVDAGFKARLLAEATAACAELGINPANPNAPTVLVALENTPSLHNLVVCTLCSCYPAKLLGLSPEWYKSRAYRCRAVREPRRVLSEFGTQLPAEVAVRVHDSTADCRYMVVPMRPAGTEGWSEERLAGLVSRDSLIGIAPASAP